MVVSPHRRIAVACDMGIISGKTPLSDIATASVETERPDSSVVVSLGCSLQETSVEHTHSISKTVRAICLYLVWIFLEIRKNVKISIPQRYCKQGLSKNSADFF
jgi:hypothetical protein